MKQLLAVMILAVGVLAQDSSQSAQTKAVHPSAAGAQMAVDLAAQVPAPKQEDVATRDGILRALYDVISGPAGDRDWNRFRSLFPPQVRFTQTGKKPDGTVFVNPMSEEQFIQLATEVFKSAPFYEKAIVNKAQSYGNITQVFSSYESRRAPGEKPFDRGINSIQLFNDGKRWWVMSILWDDERPDNPLPKAFASRK